MKLACLRHLADLLKLQHTCAGTCISKVCQANNVLALFSIAELSVRSEWSSDTYGVAMKLHVLFFHHFQKAVCLA